jgi:hypothetical protein
MRFYSNDASPSSSRSAKRGRTTKKGNYASMYVQFFCNNGLGLLLSLFAIPKFFVALDLASRGTRDILHALTISLTMQTTIVQGIHETGHNRSVLSVAKIVSIRCSIFEIFSHDGKPEFRKMKNLQNLTVN